MQKGWRRQPLQDGRSAETRTPCLLVPNQALYRVSYTSPAIHFPHYTGCWPGCQGASCKGECAKEEFMTKFWPPAAESWLRQLLGFTPKNPTTFEKVDETFTICSPEPRFKRFILDIPLARAGPTGTASYTGWRRTRFGPSGPDGCPALQYPRPGRPGYCWRSGWWRAGGR